MRRAAQVATIGFAGMIVFEVALAAGAPLGDAAWGGAHTDLTTGQRFSSAVSVLFYAAAIVVVRRRAAGRAERRYRWGTWGLAVVFALAALMNLASESQWENYLMAPVALVFAALCVIVARAPTGHRGRGRKVPRRPSHTPEVAAASRRAVRLGWSAIPTRGEVSRPGGELTLFEAVGRGPDHLSLCRSSPMRNPQ